MKAGDKFQQPSRRVNELWQTDFTYFKIVGWGWYYLSTVLDDYSRFIVVWRLCTTMSANDVSDTLDDALAFTELNQVNVQHRPRLLSDNRPYYISGELVDYLIEMAESYARRPLSPTNARKDRTLPSLYEKSNLAQSPLLTERARRATPSLRELLQSRSSSRVDRQPKPADVYYEREEAILTLRKQIKLNTIG